jgi:hypothetical protein
VFRAHLKLHDASDINEEVVRLRDKAERARLPKSSIEELISNFATVVQPLIESGRTMRSQGSVLNVTRTLDGAGYKVMLDFSTDNSVSLIERFKRLLLGR